MTRSLVSVGKAYWKLTAGFTAFAGWALAKEKPEFAITTKLAYLVFLVKVYWPELMLLSVLALAIVWGWGKFFSNGIKPSLENAWRALRKILQYASFGDLALGALALFIVGSLMLPQTLKQLRLLCDIETQFYGGRLANWFGTDRHAIAARQIRRADYALAAQTLQAQAGELDAAQEADTAREVQLWIEGHVEPIAKLTPLLKSRIDQQGVTRSDLLVQGSMQAMRPTWSIGEPSRNEIYGAAQLPVYLKALLRARRVCNGEDTQDLSRRDIAQAVSALGFARWPNLFFGSTADDQDRRSILCSVVGAMSVTELESAHRSAFSVSGQPKRADWRAALRESGATTLLSDVVEALVGALDVPFRKSMSSAPFTRLHERLTGSKDFMIEQEQEITSIEPAEMGFLSVVSDGEVDRPLEREDRAAAFTPVTYLKYRGEHMSDLSLTTFVTQTDARALLLCRNNKLSTGALSALVTHDGDGRLKIQNTDFCGHAVLPSVSRNIPVDRSVGALLALLARMNVGDMNIAADVSKGLVREALCETVASHIATSDVAHGTEVTRLCPVHALAHDRLPRTIPFEISAPQRNADDVKTIDKALEEPLPR